MVALAKSEKSASATVGATMSSIHRFCCVVQLLLQYAFASSEVGEVVFVMFSLGELNGSVEGRR